jgi:hypothetical protein
MASKRGYRYIRAKRIRGDPDAAIFLREADAEALLPYLATICGPFC